MTEAPYRCRLIPPITPVPRPTKCRDTPCRHCPSTSSDIDPETQGILTWDRPQQLETVFSCAWTKRQLCRGYCDRLKLSADEIESVLSRP